MSNLSGFKFMDISDFHKLVSKIEDEDVREDVINEIERLTNRIKSLEIYLPSLTERFYEISTPVIKSNKED